MGRVRIGALLAITTLFFVFAAACGGGDSSAPSKPSPSDAGVEASPPRNDTPYCANGRPTVSYPNATPGFAILDTLADITFAGMDAKGPRNVSLHDYFEPCASQSKLVVIRVSAGWCGTCRWHVAHTRELTSLDVGSRLEILDLIVAGDQNLPPTVADLTVWKSRIDAPQTLAADPTFALGPITQDPMPLPLIVLVDTRTMTIRNYLDNPGPDLLALRIHQEIDGLDHVPEPVGSPPQVFDDLYTRDQWDELHDMAMPGPPPPDPTNAHADDAAAATLGEQLFSDTTLSPSNTVSCATCHDPAKSYADGKAQAVGVATGDRNAPSLLLASYSPWQFWDGRADSQWMQATGPLENAKEFNSSRLFVAHAISDRYNASYAAIFGALPDLSNAAQFPASGKPGDASWTGMAPADQAAVTTIYSNVGKSIEAFERTLRVQPNALDAYIGGNLAALTTDQKTGLTAFFITGCVQCHWGPRMTDDAFHVTRFPTGRQDGAADRGRIDGIPLLLASEFLETGVNSDSKTDSHGLASLVAAPSTLGAFKTPPLRGVADTAPYGHGGTLGALISVAKNYGTAGLPTSDTSAVGVSEPWLPKFDSQNQQQLPTFLSVLTAPRAP
ncbi:MAG: cytochrome c peroxidase [Polyangiaceae bacterium]